MERIKQQRAPQHKPNVLASHAGSNPLEGVTGQVVSLRNIKPEGFEHIAVGQTA
jgi:hypothetical protein